MLIDTHAHLNFDDYKEDADKVIKRALDNDIWIINIGTRLANSEKAIKYARKYKKGVYAAIGLHPSDVDKEEDFEEYKKLAQDKKVVAIGEIGLDYFRLGDNGEEIKYKQKQIFMEQLDLARQLDKPVIIHCRDVYPAGSRRDSFGAYQDLFELLSVFSAGCASCPHACPGAGGSKPLRGVVHCFAGDTETAKKFLDIGFYISFTGMITFSEDYDDVIKEIPLDRLLVETDCPYLTPVPHRGKRNEPIYVKYVAEKIAALKELDFEEVADKTTKNAKELFGI